MERRPCPQTRDSRVRSWKCTVEEIGWILGIINCQSLLLCRNQQACPSRTVLIAEKLRFLTGNSPFLWFDTSHSTNYRQDAYDASINPDALLLAIATL